MNIRIIKENHIYKKNQDRLPTEFDEIGENENSLLFKETIIRVTFKFFKKLKK